MQTAHGARSPRLNLPFSIKIGGPLTKLVTALTRHGGCVNTQHPNGLRHLEELACQREYRGADVADYYAWITIYLIQEVFCSSNKLMYSTHTGYY